MTAAAADWEVKERGAAIRAAFFDACGLPSAVVFASYVGFGSLVRETGVGLPAGLVSTATAWALPGQMALVELYSAGASLFAIGLAVLLTNTRLAPMTATLIPLLRRPGVPPWRYWLAAHVVAVTTWANALARLPRIAPNCRLAWFETFAACIFAATLLGATAGYFLAGLLPRPVTLGMVFLNPLYFLLLFAGDLRRRGQVLALGFGLCLGPALHAFSPGYGLLISGAAAGTAAFLIDEALKRRGARHAAD